MSSQAHNKQVGRSRARSFSFIALCQPLNATPQRIAKTRFSRNPNSMHPVLLRILFSAVGKFETRGNCIFVGQQKREHLHTTRTLFGTSVIPINFTYAELFCENQRKN